MIVRANIALPREHGAWFMLGQCLVIGAATSRSFVVPVLLVILSSYSLFVGLEGLKQLRRRLQAGEARSLWDLPRSSKIFIVASGSLGLAAVFGWGLRVLLFWGLLSLLLVSLYTVLLFRRKERSISAEGLGILGITLSAAAAWSAGTGRLGQEAFLLWGVCFVYFAGSVPYVKLRVKQMKSGPASLSSRLALARNAWIYSLLALAVVSVGVVAGEYSWLMTVPFLLLVAKIVWVTGRGKAPPSLAHVGYAEVFYSTAFTVFAILAFR
jgi:hypothetical protein